MCYIFYFDGASDREEGPATSVILGLFVIAVRELAENRSVTTYPMYKASARVKTVRGP